jgi:hypothetical protein
MAVLKVLLQLLVLAVYMSYLASAAPCRMQQGSDHEFCGLPYELSNFQGKHLIAAK